VVVSELTRVRLISGVLREKAAYRVHRDEQGRQVVVRNGSLPERTITTGIGEGEIQVSLRQKQYVYIWADGIYVNIYADERQCILVVIGVTDKAT
jgi:transposase-like protein